MKYANFKFLNILVHILKYSDISFLIIKNKNILIYQI